MALTLNYTPHKCAFCKGDFSNDDISSALIKHGFFVLVAQDEEFLFINCPDELCHAPFLFRRGPSGTINAFFDQISYGAILRLNDKTFSYDFIYHSSCHIWTKELLARQYPQLKFESYSTENSDSLYDELVHYENNVLNLNGYYCTALLDKVESDAYSLINVWWLNNNQVQQILEIEKEQKIRIFPRYMPVDPVFNEIDQFTWNYQLKKHFYGSLKNFPFPVTSTENVKNSVVKNHSFLSLMDLLPQQLNATINRIEINSTSHRPSLILSILKESNLFDFSNIANAALSIDAIWNAYYDKTFQEYVSIVSDEFVHDYLKLYSHINFGLPSVWNLLCNYLIKLIEFLPKKRQRAELLNNSKVKFIKKVQQNYPAFDSILSNDFELHKIKEEVGIILTHTATYETFLLLGEQGTGKTLFAKAIHNASKRNGKFLKVNCANIGTELFESQLFGYKKGAFSGADKDNTGYLESANNGTIFLDEVGNLPADLQAKLLTVIEDRCFLPVGSNESVHVNVNMVFATNKNLKEAVRKGDFRADLYSRIKVFSYKLPPLRERKGDVSLLTKYFIKMFAAEYGKHELEELPVNEEGIKFLDSQKWPGNTRDLKALIKKIIALRANDDLQNISVGEIKLRAPEDTFQESFGSDLITKQRKSKEMPLIEEYSKLRDSGKAISTIAEEYGYSREHFSRTIEKKYLAQSKNQ